MKNENVSKQKYTYNKFNEVITLVNKRHQTVTLQIVHIFSIIAL